MMYGDEAAKNLHMSPLCAIMKTLKACVALRVPDNTAKINK